MPTPDPNASVYAELCQIMNTDWDPIGSCPEDEYYAYSARVYVMLKEGLATVKIAEYLNWVQKERMDLGSDMNRSTKVAELIFHLKDRLV